MEIIPITMPCKLRKKEKSHQWLMGAVSFLHPHIYLNEIPNVYPFKVIWSLWNLWHFDEKCNKRNQCFVFMVSPWKFAGLTLRIPNTMLLSTKQQTKPKKRDTPAPLERNQSLMLVRWSVSVTRGSERSEACCQVQNRDVSCRLVLSWPARLNGDWGVCVKCTPGKSLQGSPNYRKSTRT